MVPSPEPEPYLYQVPAAEPAGLATARIKNEDLAEAFVSRLKPYKADLLVMQQEKLVLVESFSGDSASFLCVGAMFPPYVGALIGRLYQHATMGPAPFIPLQDFYPSSTTPSVLAMQGRSFTTDYHQATEASNRLTRLVEESTANTLSMAAEELVFEPLAIDVYQWKEGGLCLPPYALAQLSSLFLRSGRWGEEQFLPESLTKQVLAPAYASIEGKKQYGWEYYRLRAKGRKQPLLYWQSHKLQLFLLPELEAVVLLANTSETPPDLWLLLQQYMIPALMP